MDRVVGATVGVGPGQQCEGVFGWGATARWGWGLSGGVNNGLSSTSKTALHTISIGLQNSWS